MKMENVHKTYGPYERFLKRPLDFILAFVALIVLSPMLLILTIVGAVAMKGNPFFMQKRVGCVDKKTGQEKIFALIKFRTMSNAKDKDGKLLPDEKRLNRYGRLLRSTSCDELPSLINIILGELSCCGPRPLMPEYLPYYTNIERHRHDVKPGLTGLAQVNGRSFIAWEEIFMFDLEYVNKITFIGDMKILLRTIIKVFKRENIADPAASRMDSNGKLHFIVGGKDVTLHQSLDKEREKYEAGDRK